MLTSQQQQIVHSSFPRFIVEAQPGSGKTRILVERFVNAIIKGNCLPHQMVAITFTEKAAQEIKDRVLLRLPQAKNTPLWISTIHGFCHRILKEHVWKTELPLFFSVLSSEQILFLQNKAIRTAIETGVKEKDESLNTLLAIYGVSKLESLLHFLFSRRYLFKTVLLLRQDPCDAVEQIFDNAYAIYENLKSGKQACDFEDLLEKTLILLKQNEPILLNYQKQFKMILVDEFQDTNPIQKELIDLLNPSSLMVVGDPKQAIYRFRGADLDLFYDVKKDIVEKEGFCFELLENFRSSPQLIQFVNTLFQSSSVFPHDKYSKDSHIEYAKPKILHCSPPLMGGGRGRVKDESWSSLEGRKKEAKWLAAHVKEMGKIIPWSEIAILFRAMTFSSIYEEALNEEAVPWVRRDLGFLYESPEVIGLTALLKWSLNPKDDLSFWTFSSQFKTKDIFELAKERKKQGFSFYELIFSTKNPTCETLKTCLQKIHFMKERISLEEWFRLFPIPNNETVRKFLKMVRDFEFQNKECEWKDFLEYIELLQKSHAAASPPQEEMPKEGIQLLTIHQAKGLEFEAVYVPDLAYLPRKELPAVLIDKKLGIGLKVPNLKGEPEEDKIYAEIKIQEQKKDKEESKRLFYVALTRAKRYLTLSHGSRKPKPSSWAGWIEEHKEIFNGNISVF